jgi:ribonuclease R
VDLGAGKLQKRLTKALQEFENKPEAQILNILTLRSMSQAKYSPNNVGHFGLGFEDYTHFTSPIRRYPDLIVHRLIKNQVMPNSKYRLIPADDLASAGTMLSACEQRSVKAERQLQGIKKARYMHKHLGEEFDGIISSVTKFGVFVLLRGVEVDGLIRTDDLGTQKFEKFDFDEDNLQLVSARSGLRYCIGDLLKVKVVSVDIEAGQVNFELAQLPKKSAPQPDTKLGEHARTAEQHKKFAGQHHKVDEGTDSEKKKMPFYKKVHKKNKPGGKNKSKRPGSDKSGQGKKRKR